MAEKVERDPSKLKTEVGHGYTHTDDQSFKVVYANAVAHEKPFEQVVHAALGHLADSFDDKALGSALLKGDVDAAIHAAGAVQDPHGLLWLFMKGLGDTIEDSFSVLQPSLAERLTALHARRQRAKMPILKSLGQAYGELDSFDYNATAEWVPSSSFSDLSAWGQPIKPIAHATLRFFLSDEELTNAAMGQYVQAWWASPPKEFAGDGVVPTYMSSAFNPMKMRSEFTLKFKDEGKLAKELERWHWFKHDGPKKFQEEQTQLLASASMKALNPKSLDWINQHAAELVSGISEGTRANIKSIMQQHYQGQLTVPQAIQAIRGSVGLNGAQSSHLSKLVASGASAGQQQTYIKSARDYRAQMIARTETIAASNRGQQALWEEATKAGFLDPSQYVKQVVLTFNACETCEMEAAEAKDLDDDNIPPYHPNCRCAMGLENAQGQEVEDEGQAPEGEDLEASVEEEAPEEPIDEGVYAQPSLVQSGVVAPKVDVQALPKAPSWPACNVPLQTFVEKHWGAISIYKESATLDLKVTAAKKWAEGGECSYQWDDTKKADAWFTKLEALASWKKGLKSSEKEALWRYRSDKKWPFGATEVTLREAIDDYFSMKAAGDPVPYDLATKVQTWLKHLDSAASKFSLPFHTTTYGWVKLDDLKDTAMVHSHNYLHVYLTEDQGLADQGMGNWAKVELGQGQHGIYLDAFSKPGEGQGAFLLPRDTTLKVVGKYKADLDSEEFPVLGVVDSKGEVRGIAGPDPMKEGMPETGAADAGKLTKVENGPVAFNKPAIIVGNYAIEAGDDIHFGDGFGMQGKAIHVVDVPIGTGTFMGSWIDWTGIPGHVFEFKPTDVTGNAAGIKMVVNSATGEQKPTMDAEAAEKPPFVTGDKVVVHTLNNGDQMATVTSDEVAGFFNVKYDTPFSIPDVANPIEVGNVHKGQVDAAGMAWEKPILPSILDALAPHIPNRAGPLTTLSGLQVGDYFHLKTKTGQSDYVAKVTSKDGNHVELELVSGKVANMNWEPGHKWAAYTDVLDKNLKSETGMATGTAEKVAAPSAAAAGRGESLLPATWGVNDLMTIPAKVEVGDQLHIVSNGGKNDFIAEVVKKATKGNGVYLKYVSGDIATKAIVGNSSGQSMSPEQAKGGQVWYMNTHHWSNGLGVHGTIEKFGGAAPKEEPEDQITNSSGHTFKVGENAVWQYQDDEGNVVDTPTGKVMEVDSLSGMVKMEFPDGSEATVPSGDLTPEVKPLGAGNYTLDMPVNPGDKFVGWTGVTWLVKSVDENNVTIENAEGKVTTTPKANMTGLGFDLVSPEAVKWTTSPEASMVVADKAGVQYVHVGDQFKLGPDHEPLTVTKLALNDNIITVINVHGAETELQADGGIWKTMEKVPTQAEKVVTVPPAEKVTVSYPTMFEQTGKNPEALKWKQVEYKGKPYTVVGFVASKGQFVIEPIGHEGDPANKHATQHVKSVVIPGEWALKGTPEMQKVNDLVGGSLKAVPWKGETLSVGDWLGVDGFDTGKAPNSMGTYGTYKVSKIDEKGFYLTHQGAGPMEFGPYTEASSFMKSYKKLPGAALDSLGITSPDAVTDVGVPTSPTPALGTPEPFNVEKLKKGQLVSFYNSDEELWLLGDFMGYGEGSMAGLASIDWHGDDYVVDLGQIKEPPKVALDYPQGTELWHPDLGEVSVQEWKPDGSVHVWANNGEDMEYLPLIDAANLKPSADSTETVMMPKATDAIPVMPTPAEVTPKKITVNDLIGPLKVIDSGAQIHIKVGKTDVVAEVTSTSAYNSGYTIFKYVSGTIGGKDIVMAQTSAQATALNAKAQAGEHPTWAISQKALTNALGKTGSMEWLYPGVKETHPAIGLTGHDLPALAFKPGDVITWDSGSKLLVKEQLPGLGANTYQVVGMKDSTPFAGEGHQMNMGQITGAKVKAVDHKPELLSDSLTTPPATPVAKPDQFVTKPLDQQLPGLASTPIPTTPPSAQMGHPDLSTATVVPMSLEGAHPKTVYKTPDGAKWMFKPDPDPITSIAEKSANDVMAYLGLPSPELYVTKVKGKLGSLQRMFEDVVPVRINQLGTLTQDQIEQVQRHQVVDWLLSQHDTNDGALLKDKAGNIIAVDKGQAYKFFGKDKLQYGYNPNPNPTVYNRLFSDFKAGTVKLSWSAIEPILQSIEAMPESQLRAMIKPYGDQLVSAKFRPGTTRSLFKTSDEFVDAVLHRAATIRADFEKLYKDNGVPVVAAPKIVSPVQIKGAVSPIHDQFVKGMHEAGWAGKAIMIAGPVLEDAHLLAYTVDKTAGGQTLVLEGKIRPEGEALLKAKLNLKVAASPVALPKVDDPVWDPFVAAVKTVNTHLKAGGDGQPNASTITGLVAAAKKILDTKNDELIKHYDGQFLALTGKTLAQVSNMGAAPLMEAVKATKAVGQPFEQFVPAPPKPEKAEVKTPQGPWNTSQPYLKAGEVVTTHVATTAKTSDPTTGKPILLEHGTAQTFKDLPAGETLTVVLGTAKNNDKYMSKDALVQVKDDEGHVFLVPQGDLARAVVQGDDAAPAVPVASTQPVIVTQTTPWRLKVMNEAGTLKTSGAKLTEMGGTAYELDFGQGLKGVYIPHGDSSKFSKMGRITLYDDSAGPVTPAKILNAVAQLKRAGLDFQLAQAGDLELVYLQKVAFAAKLDQDPTYKAVLAKWTGSTTTQEKVDSLVAFWNARLKVADVRTLPTYKPLPKYGTAYNPSMKMVQRGEAQRPYWERFDVNPSMIKAELPNLRLVHSVTGGQTPIGLLKTVLANNGWMANTEERIRMGLASVSGMSSSADQGTGGASYFFTRLHNGPGSDLTFSPDLLLRTDNVSYGSDMYGNTDAAHLAKRKSGLGADGWKSIMSNGSNETIIKHGFNLLDYLERFNSHGHKAEAVALFKQYGITQIRGVPVEQIVV